MRKKVTLDVFLGKEDKYKKRKEIRKPLPQLPRGWKWVRLKDVAKISSGGTPKRSVKEYWNGDIPWVKIMDIPENGLVLDTEEKITEKGLMNSSAKMFPKGTILFSIFATIAKVGILGIDAATNQAIAGIQIKNVEKVDRKYLFYCLRNFGLSLLSIGRGMAQRNINQTILKNLQIPLPPLEEQKRIVAKIEEVLSRVEKAKRLKAEARKDAEAIMQAALHEVFSKAEEKWKLVKLKEVLKQDRRTIDPQKYPNKKFWLITMDCVESSTGRLIKRIELKGKEIKSMKYSFNSSHILYGKLRPYLNKVFVPKDEEEGICTTEFIPFLAVNAEREYVAHYLRTKKVVSHAMNNLTGTRQPRVNIDALLEYPIPFPPLEEQKRIASYLNSIQEKILTIRKMQEQTEEILENITPVVLDRAFKGKL